MIGKRVYPHETGQLVKYLDQQGSYGHDASGEWWAHAPAPGCPIAALSDHQITEHEDGTISVSPSILWEGKYHGYLQRGVWIES